MSIENEDKENDVMESMRPEPIPEKKKNRRYAEPAMKKRNLSIYLWDPGSVHDARVFENSPIHNTLSTSNEEEHILGDSAYPLSDHVNVPFKDNGHLTGAQKHFNKIHSKCRVCIEHKFGLLKQRFRQLYHLKLRNPERHPAVSPPVKTIHGSESDPQKLKGRLLMIKDMTLNRFVYHAHPSLSQMLRYREFNSIGDALTAAIAEEKALYIIITSKNQFSVSKQINFAQQNRPEYTPRKNFDSTHTNGSNLNQPHNSNVKQCRYCKNLGHTIEECRKRQYNNSRKNQKTGPHPKPAKVSDKGLQPNPSKIDAIYNVQKPRNPKEVRIFLGMIGYYRKFIKDFSTIAKSLTKLLKKDSEYQWSQEQETAFQRLKQELVQKPILQYPDFSKEFVLTTDASNIGIGGVLSQFTNGEDLPISYYSRTLNPAETNYSTTEKELLAILNSMEHFRPYLYGRKFTIYTDHRPLQWLFNCQNPSSRLVRWRLRMNEYEYDIKYKPGRINCNTDGLSRLLPELRTINFTTPDDKYQDFIKFHYTNQDVIMFDKESKPLTKLKDPTILLWSQDLDESNQYADYINSNFDVSNANPSINGITELNS
ncbi:uncharacterized protein [Onthophagus taurus]|uniref:uncharacterized protein n=1 Tax=Onthophagus taurus TaxID=166361 RepID=UPI0039BE4F78